MSDKDVELLSKIIDDAVKKGKSFIDVAGRPVLQLPEFLRIGFFPLTQFLLVLR